MATPGQSGDLLGIRLNYMPNWTHMVRIAAYSRIRAGSGVTRLRPRARLSRIGNRGPGLSG